MTSCNGRLCVERGAIGTIRRNNQGYVGVVFDPGQEAYIELDGSGRTFQEVPFIQTRPICLDKASSVTQG